MISIIDKLENNIKLFSFLLEENNNDFIYWRPQPNKWCLLEIVCHLYDEEREDFRFRTKWVLEKPGTLPPMFNPLDWVIKNNYIDQDYHTVCTKFLEERKRSVSWLKALKDPKWDNFYIHPKLGKLTAKHYVSNWLAHDYLHIRQIIKQRFEFLKNYSGENLEYAGVW